MNIVIIEDEKAAVRNLKSILTAHYPHIHVIAELDSIIDTLDWFDGHEQPDLVFMDIHLADGSAFEIFEHIRITAPIIFTTAYNEYALKAFKVNSIDYLLKPIGPDEVERAIRKLEQLKALPSPVIPDYQPLIDSLKQKERYKTHFLIPVKGDKLLPLPVEDIYYFCIMDGVVKAVTTNGKTYSFPHHLDELTASLNPSDFFRVNRQFLISRRSVKDLDLWFNSRLSVNLKVPTEEKIVVSKAKVTEFKEWFTGGL